MILYPDIYIKNVLEINEDIIKSKEIKALLLDVDNTLMHYNKTTIEGLEEWIKQMKALGIKLCILSNNNNKEKVGKLANILDIPFICFAKKPMKSGFKRAIKMLEIDAKNIGVVGDQIFTDILGANRMHMVSILTKPLEKRDFLVTKIKRPFENAVIKGYLKRGSNKHVSK